MTVAGSPKLNKGINENPLFETFILPDKLNSLDSILFCERYSFVLPHVNQPCRKNTLTSIATPFFKNFVCQKNIF